MTTKKKPTFQPGDLTKIFDDTVPRVYKVIKQDGNSRDKDKSEIYHVDRNTGIEDWFYEWELNLVARKIT